MKKKLILSLALVLVLSVALIACTPVPTDGLSSITVQAELTEYYVGQKFDTSKILVTAKYSDETTKAVTGFTVDKTAALTTADKEVVVSYTEAGITKTATLKIRVSVAPASFKKDIVQVGYSIQEGAESVARVFLYASDSIGNGVYTYVTKTGYLEYGSYTTDYISANGALLIRSYLFTSDVNVNSKGKSWKIDIATNGVASIPADSRSLGAYTNETLPKTNLILVASATLSESDWVNATGTPKSVAAVYTFRNTVGNNLFSLILNTNSTYEYYYYVAPGMMGGAHSYQESGTYKFMKGEYPNGTVSTLSDFTYIDFKSTTAPIATPVSDGVDDKGKEKMKLTTYDWTLFNTSRGLVPRIEKVITPAVPGTPAVGETPAVPEIPAVTEQLGIVRYPTANVSATLSDSSTFKNWYNPIVIKGTSGEVDIIIRGAVQPTKVKFDVEITVSAGIITSVVICDTSVTGTADRYTGRWTLSQESYVKSLIGLTVAQAKAIVADGEFGATVIDGVYNPAPVTGQSVRLSNGALVLAVQNALSQFEVVNGTSGDVTVKGKPDPVKFDVEVVVNSGKISAVTVKDTSVTGTDTGWQSKWTTSQESYVKSLIGLTVAQAKAIVADGITGAKVIDGVYNPAPVTGSSVQLSNGVLVLAVQNALSKLA